MTSLFYSIYHDFLFFILLLVIPHWATASSSQISLVKQPANVIKATPQNYQKRLNTLNPGDTLLLAAGQYRVPPTGFLVADLHGTASHPITIKGPASGKKAILLGNAHSNVIRLKQVSHVVFQHLEINGRNLGGDAIKAEGITHHITLDNLFIHGVGAHQQIVGISTKAPAWNWIIKHCRILNAGTGIYLGDSNGSAPFINGIIEYNQIVNSRGYNLQIKHQRTRLEIASPLKKVTKTIIRHNIFSKARRSSQHHLARPNVLIGHKPLSGPGHQDYYEIYGNLFYQNPHEALFQGEGHLALYNNIFYNTLGSAIHLLNHHDRPKKIDIFFNTILAKNTGLLIKKPDRRFQQRISGNIIFAGKPIKAKSHHNNIVNHLNHAQAYFVKPFGNIGIDASVLSKSFSHPLSTHFLKNIQHYTDWQKDFNQQHRLLFYAGAYSSDTSPKEAQLTLKKSTEL